MSHAITVLMHEQQFNSTMLLTQLPPEIIHNILRFVELDDLPTIPLICRFFNEFVKDNNALYRAIYLRLLVHHFPCKHSPHPHSQ